MATDADDNRIRLDQTPVDFSVTDVVDQLHSSYPAPNTQARYDLMRSYLIGLLSHQSSPSDFEPLEKRIGTTWFNKTIQMLLLFDGDKFDSIAKFLSVSVSGSEGTDDSVASLQSVLDNINSSMAYVGPKIVWSGVFNTDEVDSIPVPSEFKDYSKGLTPFVYLQGLLIDPRKTIIKEDTPQQINLIGVDAKPRQTYTVVLEKVTYLKTETVVAEGSNS